MSRLPQPGGDDGAWGAILNDYLNQAHNNDGSLKSTAVAAANAMMKDTLVFNVKDHGAVGDGTTDDTAAIQATINLGGVTYFPPGLYQVKGLTVTAGSQLKGAGSSGYGTYVPDTNHSSALRTVPGYTGNLLTGPAGAAHVLIEDLELNGYQTAANGIYIADDAAGEECQWALNRVYVHHFATDGIYVGSNRRALKAYKCVFNFNGRYGVNIAGSDSGWDSCIVGDNTSDGIFINNSVTRIDKCDVYGNANGITVASNTMNNSIIATGIDRNKQAGIYVQPLVNFVSIIGNLLHSNSVSGDGVYPHISLNNQNDTNVVVGNTFGYLDVGVTQKVSTCVFVANGVSFHEGGNALAYTAVTNGKLTNWTPAIINFGYSPVTITSNNDTVQALIVQSHSGTATANILEAQNNSGTVMAYIHPTGAIATGYSTTAGRPSAASVGVGAHFFDTTLNKPIWSDGTNWRDATGAIV